MQTFAVALASPLPQIEIPVGTGANAGHHAGAVRQVRATTAPRSTATQGEFQPTNQIVDFYVENLAADRPAARFQVNFEDVEAGNDHDMDAIVALQYRVVAAIRCRWTCPPTTQAGGIIQHIGYVISGTTADGVYLVVQDCNKTSAGTYNCNGTDPDYFLDTPTAKARAAIGTTAMRCRDSRRARSRPRHPAVGHAAERSAVVRGQVGRLQGLDGDDMPELRSEPADPSGTPTATANRTTTSWSPTR